MTDIVEVLTPPNSFSDTATVIVSAGEMRDASHLEYAALRAENERLRAALEEWREAARFNITMEGAQYTGVEHSRALKAWEKTRAALEERT